MDKRNIVGYRIKAARHAVTPKITQAQLSARLQLQGVMLVESTIGKIEHGLSAVTDIQLVAFSKALGVSVLWLLGLED